MQRSLPPSLASVRPFLEEARAILAQQSPQKTSKKIALYCIEHAQQALAAAHAQLGEWTVGHRSSRGYWVAEGCGCARVLWLGLSFRGNAGRGLNGSLVRVR